MENSIIRIGSLSILPIILFSLITGCASSNVSRDAASNVDMGVNNAEKMGGDISSGDVAESYQNASQATKGALIGGTTGAVAGSFASPIGFIPGALVGGAIGLSYGKYIDSQVTLADELINRGANVIEIGDQVLVVIDSERIFSGMSAKFKPQAYSTLNLVTRFINSFPQMLVKVSTYTDDIGTPSVNLALSRQQARAIERYLSHNGMQTRVIYAEGYGPTNLVQKSTNEWGKSDNYRIEITLQKQHI